MDKPKLYGGTGKGLSKIPFTPKNFKQAVVINYKGQDFIGQKSFLRKYPEFAVKKTTNLFRKPKSNGKTFLGLKF